MTTLGDPRMSSSMFILLLFGTFPAVCTSTYSDYTTAIVYSLTTPFREIIEFLTEVWNYFIELLCFPFMKFLDLLKLLFISTEELFSFIIDLIVTVLNLLILQPVSSLVACFYAVTNYAVRYPLTTVTKVFATASAKVLEVSSIAKLSDSVLETLICILSFPIDKVVDLTHMLVYLVIQMPLNVLFHGILEFIVASGLKYVVSKLRAALCFLAETLRLPFIGISYILKGVISLPLYTVLNVVSFILFCIIDPVIYFIHLLVRSTTIFVLMFVIAVSTIYVFNTVSDLNVTLDGFKEATQVFTGRLIKTTRELFSSSLNQTAMHVVEEEDNNCAVCFEEKRFVKLLPCKHENLCVDCLNQILGLNARCPFCRATIQNVEYR